MRLYYLFLPLCLAVLLHSTLSAAISLTQFKKYHQGRLEFGGGISYMSSSSNFDKDSAISDLRSGASYQLIQNPLGVRYGFGDNWSLSAGLMISSSQSKNTDANRNNSSLPELHLGYDSLFYSRSYDVVGDFQFIYPLETIKSSQDTSFNSEGVMQMIGWLGIENKKNKFIWYGNAGFNYRMEGRSGLLLYKAGAGLKYPHSSFGTEFGGFQSVMDDKDKGNTTSRDDLILRMNGGSNSFYSVNPSVMEFRLWSEHDLASQMKLGLRFSYPFYGTSYVNGMTFGAQFSIAYDTMETQKSIRRLSVPLNEGAKISTDTKVEEFNEEINDDVDQELFRAPEPPPPPVRLKRTEPIPTDGDVRNQLNDAEMTIQLRSTKKKKKKRP